MKTITAEALDALLGNGATPLILDVRLADDHEAARIPNSINNCVFEVNFLDRVAEQLPDKDQPIVLCGADAHSQEARMAGEKLERLGFTDLTLLRGGVASWHVGGYPMDGGKALPPEPEPPDGRHQLDLPECRVEWLGRNLLGRHTGSVDIKEGYLDFDDGHLVGGVILFDLHTLQCDDLAGTPQHDVLIAHLHDHDFLDVGNHPEARLQILHAEPTGEPTGAPNLEVRAALTLRGVTSPIDVTVAAGLAPGGRPAAQAAFAIDRTRWGILYGSGRFFHRLAGHLVNDLIEFQVRIVCQ